MTESTDPTGDTVLDRVLAKLGLPMSATAAAPSEPAPVPSAAPHESGGPDPTAARAKGAVKRAMRPLVHQVVARVGHLIESRARETEALVERRVSEVREQLRAELAEALEQQNARLEALRAQLPR